MISKEQARDLVGRLNARLDDARDLILELYHGEGWKALGYQSWRKFTREKFGTWGRDFIGLTLDIEFLRQIRTEIKKAARK
jgi:hypothetical protein